MGGNACCVASTMLGAVAKGASAVAAQVFNITGEYLT